MNILSSVAKTVHILIAYSRKGSKNLQIMRKIINTDNKTLYNMQTSLKKKKKQLQ